MKPMPLGFGDVPEAIEAVFKRWAWTTILIADWKEKLGTAGRRAWFILESPIQHGRANQAISYDESEDMAREVAPFLANFLTACIAIGVEYGPSDPPSHVSPNQLQPSEHAQTLLELAYVELAEPYVCYILSRCYPVSRGCDRARIQADIRAEMHSVACDLFSFAAAGSPILKTLLPKR